MLADPRPTGQSIALGARKVLTPTSPTKMVALVDNYARPRRQAQSRGSRGAALFSQGEQFISRRRERPSASPSPTPARWSTRASSASSSANGAARFRRPRPRDYIFGYTCINDVTAIDIFGTNAGFAQWTRAKGFDTFGVFGPVIATGLDPAKLVVKTILNGQERQNYPLSDIIFGPDELVSLISQDMTLEAGDVIACGTSVGVGSMKPGSTVSIVIDGIGTLTNRST